GQPPSDDLLGVALVDPPSVGVGGVDEADAARERVIHQPERLRLLDASAEVDRAQTEPADRQTGTAQPDVKLVVGRDVVIHNAPTLSTYIIYPLVAPNITKCPPSSIPLISRTGEAGAK